jgi:hypothetical protein
MGNFLSGSARLSDQEVQIEKLQSRIVDLEKLDLNKDGLVSKDELQKWVFMQNQEVLQFEKSLALEFEQKYGQQMTELKKQNESLKQINQDLEKQLHELHDVRLKSHDTTENLQPLGQLSRERINQSVERMINNSTVNISYIPDFVERQIYRNVFRILIGLVDELTSQTSLEVLGHHLTFNLEALTKKIPKKDITNSDTEEKKSKNKNKKIKESTSTQRLNHRRNESELDGMN